MDGEPLADRLEGTAVSVDPGEHTFTFEAPGYAVATKRLMILEGQKDRREAVTLGVAQVETARGTTQGGPAPSSGEAGARLGTQRVLALGSILAQQGQVRSNKRPLFIGHVGRIRLADSHRTRKLGIPAPSVHNRL